MEPAKTANDNPEPIAPAVEMQTEKDYFLQDLVNAMNLYPDNEIGITLQMRGMLISGNMISGDEYFRRVASELASEGTDVHKHFLSYGDAYIEDRKNGGSDKTTTFIHLADCTFNGPANLSELRVLWRGRISEVEGFFMGVLANKGDIKAAKS